MFVLCSNDQGTHLLVLGLKRLDVSLEATLLASLTIEDTADISPTALAERLLIFHCIKQDL